MRINMESGGRRRKVAHLTQAAARFYIGMVPGPQLTLEWRPDLFHSSMYAYVNRGMSARGNWDKGESELFASFVSNLNTCNF